jgi:hypothetical protein
MMLLAQPPATHVLCNPPSGLSKILLGVVLCNQVSSPRTCSHLSGYTGTRHSVHPTSGWDRLRVFPILPYFKAVINILVAKSLTHLNYFLSLCPQKLNRWIKQSTYLNTYWGLNTHTPWQKWKFNFQPRPQTIGNTFSLINLAKWYFLTVVI